MTVIKMIWQSITFVPDTWTNVYGYSFPVNTGPGSLVLIAGLLNFKLSNGQMDKRHSFMPSSVMGARYC